MLWTKFWLLFFLNYHQQLMHTWLAYQYSSFACICYERYYRCHIIIQLILNVNDIMKLLPKTITLNWLSLKTKSINRKVYYIRFKRDILQFEEWFLLPLYVGTCIHNALLIIIMGNILQGRNKENFNYINNKKDFIIIHNTHSIFWKKN